MTRRSRRGGFTAIEMMFALLVMAMVLPTIVGLRKVEATTSMVSRHSTRASALARDQIEKLTLDQPSAHSGTDMVVDDGQPGDHFRRSWVETLTPNAVFITVTVSWLDGTTERELTQYGRRDLR